MPFDLLALLKAVLLGVVEGLTEFLPVSSTGHLLLMQRFFGFDDEDFGKTFAVLIQLGAILAILSIYFAKLWQIFIGMFTDPAPRRFVHRRADRVPAGGGHRRAGARLHQGRAVQSVGRLLHADRRRRGPAVGRPARAQAALSRRHARSRCRCISRSALFQCLAMIPGVSRSGATIVSAMLLGADKRSAAEFSFFLAMPTMAGAFTYDLYQELQADDVRQHAAGRGRLRHLVRRRLDRGEDAARLRVAPRLCAVRLVARDRRLARPDRAGARANRARR